MHLEQTPKTWNFSCKVLLHCFLSVVFWVLSILASSHPLDGSLANASAQRLSDVQSDPNPTVLRMKVDWFSEFYKHHKTCINIFHWLTSLIVYTHLIVYHIHVFHVTSSYRTVSCKLSLPVLAWCENLRNWRQWCPSSHRLQWALPEEVFICFHAEVSREENNQKNQWPLKKSKKSMDQDRHDVFIWYHNLYKWINYIL